MRPMGESPQFCPHCGASLGEARNCPSCGWSLPKRPRRLSVPPEVQRRRERRLSWAVVSVAVAALVIVAVLRTVPFPQRANFETGSTVTGPTLRGCGETLFDLSGWTFPAGKLIHISWSTNPATDVFVNMSTILTTSFGPTFFWSHESSGEESFSANGGAYEVNVTNCETQSTTATISAYYSYNAPIL